MDASTDVHKASNGDCRNIELGNGFICKRFVHQTYLCDEKILEQRLIK